MLSSQSAEQFPEGSAPHSAAYVPCTTEKEALEGVKRLVSLGNHRCVGYDMAPADPQREGLQSVRVIPTFEGDRGRVLIELRPTLYPVDYKVLDGERAVTHGAAVECISPTVMPCDTAKSYTLVLHCRGEYFAFPVSFGE